MASSKRGLPLVEASLVPYPDQTISGPLALIPWLDVEELLHLTESGMTEPFFCRLSDGEIYVVKGKQATSAGLIKEAICGRLGQNFGLPVPPFAIAHLDAGLASTDPGANS